MHQLIFTIPSVIQMSSISSIHSFRLRFNLRKPRMLTITKRWVPIFFVMKEQADLIDFRTSQTRQKLENLNISNDHRRLTCDLYVMAKIAEHNTQPMSGKVCGKLT